MTLTPRYRPLGEFRFGSWAWGHLLHVAGPVLGPLWVHGARWYRVHGIDRRYRDLDYPEALGDSGRHFYVKADEARHLARVARNWATIQQVLPASHAMASLLLRDHERPFPEKMRDDWPPLFLAFADWAERSRGFSK